MRRTKTLLIGDILNDFFSQPHIAAKVAEGRLPDTWSEVVGERVAALTTQLKLERGCLYVHVTSSVVRSELNMRRQSLIGEINRISGVNLVRNIMIK